MALGWAVLATGLLLLGDGPATAAALDPVVVRGNAFFNSRTGARFFLRGVDYQPGGSSAAAGGYDPLADAAACARDVPYMQQLGLNTVRVYAVDNAADHAACMGLLARAGIYLLLDVNTPAYSVNRAAPAGSYNAVYLQHVFATVDAFKRFDNLLGLFSGNEVVNDAANTAVAPYIKAVTRDLKAYIRAQSARAIPVGYSAADVAENRLVLAEYLNCGDDPLARVDFYAFNQYAWCGNSSLAQSGYGDRVRDFAHYSVPLFFSEFGCNTVRPRLFTEIRALYSPDMASVFSGGLVYEFTNEANNYGLVSLAPNRSTLTLLPDFHNLKAELGRTADPAGDGGYAPARPPAACPANSIVFRASPDLPALPAGAQAYIDGGAGKALGNTGSSMDIGSHATPDTPPGEDSGHGEHGGHGKSSDEHSDEHSRAAPPVRHPSTWLLCALLLMVLALSVL